jgi:hypothetical protein
MIIECGCLTDSYHSRLNELHLSHPEAIIALIRNDTTLGLDSGLNERTSGVCSSIKGFQAITS